MARAATGIFSAGCFEAAIDAGATTVNLPDTVGYAIPDEFGKMVRHIYKNTPNIDRAILSVHCHDDLGLATANTLTAIQAGARQAEVTLNGIGERAGNTSMEEVVMALHTRHNHLGLETGINTEHIHASSRLVSMITGIMVQPNKAIVGANAFAHEAGIHQDGMLKNPMTYEIMRPETIGLSQTQLVLGKHSGRHALRNRLKELGYELSEEELDLIFAKFKTLADKKKHIVDEDLEVMVTEGILRTSDIFRLDYLHVTSGTTVLPMASVELVDQWAPGAQRRLRQRPHRCGLQQHRQTHRHPIGTAALYRQCLERRHGFPGRSDGSAAGKWPGGVRQRRRPGYHHGQRPRLRQRAEPARIPQGQSDQGPSGALTPSV